MGLVLLRRFQAGADFLPAARALVGLQNFLAQADGFRSDLDELIVGDEFDGLLQAQLAMWNEADCFVRARRAHVGLLLFLADVDVHVLLARIFANDHAFVYFDGRADEELAAFLNIPERKCSRWTGTIGHQGTRRAQRHFAGVIRPSVENRVDQRGAARVGQQLAAQADQPARGDFEVHAHAAGIVIAHFEHFAAPRAKRLQNDADEIFGDVDHQALKRLELLAVFVADDDFRLAHHQLKAFAPHRLDQHGDLKSAAAEDAEGFGRVRVFHANRNVGQQLSRQAIAQIARRQIAAFFARKRAAVYGEDHRQRRLVDLQGFERLRIVHVDDALAHLDAFDACDGDEVSGDHAFRFVAFESAEGVELRDARRYQLAVELADADIGAALDRAIEDAADRDASEKLAVVEVHHLNL